MGRAEFDRQTVIRSLPGRVSRIITATDSTALAVDATVSIDVYAPPGNIAEIVDALFNWSVTAGATAGSRTMVASSASGSVGLIALTFPYTATLPGYNYGAVYDGGAGAVAATTVKPSDPTAIASRLRGMTYDSSTYFRLNCRNNTDIADNGERKLYLIVTEEAIV